MTSLAAMEFASARSASLQPRGAQLFWPLALAIVLVAHLAAAWWFLAVHESLPVAPRPLPAILMDLTPAPTPPATRPPTLQPPVPQPPAPQPPATRPPTLVPQASMVEPARPLPTVPADVALPQPAKKQVKPAPKPKPTKPKLAETPPPPAPVVAKPQPTSTPAPAVPTPAVKTAAQPEQDAASAAASLAAKSSWLGDVVQHIAKFKRMPRGRLRTPLRAIVRFEISRDGKLTAQHLLQSSGRDDIDEEALAWISRADPLPKPPAEISDTELSHGFTIPVDFMPR